MSTSHNPTSNNPIPNYPFNGLLVGWKTAALPQILVYGVLHIFHVPLMMSINKIEIQSLILQLCIMEEFNMMTVCLICIRCDSDVY